MALSLSWRASLSVVAAIGLLLWHLWAGNVVRGNLLALRVMHQIVPPASTFDAPFPLADVPWVLGFTPPWQPAVERDDMLMTALEQRAMQSPSGAIMAASYAMLTN